MPLTQKILLKKLKYN